MRTTGLVKPNLLVIGAQKAGTTWLHRCLESHPNAFMSKIKELRFFVQAPSAVESGFSSYCENFLEGGNFQIRGESTPSYFWTYPDDSESQIHHKPANKNIPETVKFYLGEETRLLIALRCPVDRAISSFFHNFRAGRLNPSESILRQGKRFGILDRGHYKRHFLKWLDCFGQDRLVITFYDDIKGDAMETAKQLYARINLPNVPYLEADVVQNPGLQRAIDNGHLTVASSSTSKINQRFFEGKLRCDPNDGIIAVTQDDVYRLIDLYAEDIDFVKKLTGRQDLMWGSSLLATYVTE